MHQPGDVWMYDTSIIVLGVLLERAAGQSLEAFMRQRIFEPLAMNDTGFSVPAAKLERLPPCYGSNPTTHRPEIFDAGGRKSQFNKPPGLQAAHGGLVSTADDYLAFARMMLNKGEYRGRRLLSKRSVALMTTDHIPAEVKARSPFRPGFWDKRGWGYAISVVRESAPGDPRGFGWEGGYGISGYWDHKTGLVGVLLSQRMLESPVAPPLFVDFWRATYESIAGS